jgi:hypothetical protein
MNLSKPRQLLGRMRPSRLFDCRINCSFHGGAVGFAALQELFGRLVRLIAKW